MKIFILMLILIGSQLASANNLCSELFKSTDFKPDVSQSEIQNNLHTDIAAVTLTASEIKSYLDIEPTFFTQGKYKGQEVDQNKFRPIKRRPELETETHYFISQFYHQGKFWMARIPKTAARDVIFQLAIFKGFPGKKMAHAQMRYITDEPVVLFREENGQIVYNEVSDFIFTIQAAFPKGNKYKPIEAVLGNYLVVSRLVSTFDRAYTEEVLDKDIVTQYRLKNLTEEQKSQLLSNSVDFSTEVQLKRRYNGSEANCINLLTDIVDKTLNNIRPRWNLKFADFFNKGNSPIEQITLEEYKARKLIDEDSRLPDYTGF